MAQMKGAPPVAVPETAPPASCYFEVLHVDKKNLEKDGTLEEKDEKAKLKVGACAQPALRCD